MMIFYLTGVITLALCADSLSQDLGFKSFVRSNLEFSLDVFKEISSNNTNENRNVVVSPTSISFALSILALGAQGSTLDEISNAMKFNDTLRGDYVHKFFRKIKKQLHRNLLHYDLFIGNNMYLDDSFSLLRKFLRRSKEYYEADVQNLHFATDAQMSAKYINTWISQSTNTKIQQLISPSDIDSQTRLVLVNVVYFKADWDQKFDREATKVETFHASKDKDLPVKMMHLVRMKLKYIEDKTFNCQIVEMPYYKKSFSMILIKPNSVHASLKDLENRITAQYLISLKLREEFVTVSLPRFKLMSDYNIDDVLKKLGVTSLFKDDVADLQGMTKSKDIYVSKIAHKALIEVNEEGSEAAAATGVLITTRSERFSRYFVANHPFIFLIKDNKSGIILFIGKVMEPEIF